MLNRNDPYNLPITHAIVKKRLLKMHDYVDDSLSLLF